MDKAWEYVSKQLGLCNTLRDLRHFVEIYLKPIKEDEHAEYNKVLSALSASANLRNIKDGDLVVRISGLTSISEINAVENAGVNKTTSRIMIRRKDRSIYYLSAEEIIPAEVLDKIIVLIAKKVLSGYFMDQETRREKILPAVEYSQKNSFKRGLESILRYGLKKIFSDFQQDVVDKLDFEKCFIFTNILRDILELNRHLSLSIDSVFIKHKKVSIYFPKSRTIVEDVKILKDVNGYYYKYSRSGRRNNIDPQADIIIFERNKYKELLGLAEINTRLFLSKTIELFLTELEKDREMGLQSPDFIVRTRYVIQN